MPASDEALRLFIPITKVDVEKRLVHGVATAEKADRAGEICDYTSTKPYFEKWSADFEKNTEGKSLGNVRAMHNSIAAGKLTAIDFDDPRKTINVAAKIVDDGEWRKVIEGVYTGFSQGGRYVRRWKDDADGGLMRYTADPTEISLVDLPCLPEATFQVVKADGSTEQRHFAAKAAHPASEPQDPPTGGIGDKDAEPEREYETDVDETEVETKALELARADGLDAVTDFHKQKAYDLLLAEKAKKPGESSVTATGKAAGAGDEEPAQLWDCGCADHRHLRKSEAKRCRRERRIAESTKALTRPVDAALEELQKRIAHALGENIEEDDLDMYWKREFSQAERDKAAADGHAMPDGSFPIKSKQDLKNAISAFGRAKDPAKAKAHIIARAKDLGATDMLPEDWGKGGDDKKTTADDKKTTAVVDLAKGLAKAIEEEGTDHPGLHASMVKFHALESAKCMKAAKPGDIAKLHKSAAGSHSEAYLSHATGADDKMDKSDAAWNATMKVYGMGKADGLKPFTAPKAMAAALRPGFEKKVGKGLHGVAQLACLLDDLYCFCDYVNCEQQIEGDNSPLPGMLDQVVKDLGDVLVAMAREETDELFSDQDYGSGSTLFMAVAALPAHQRAALLKFLRQHTPETKNAAASLATAGKGNINLAVDALKVAVEEAAELTKLGARNSAADQARIQSAHDLMKDLGATCEAMANGADKSAEATELMKIQLADAKATYAALEAKFSSLVPVLETLLVKVTKIEERPLPAKASLRAVDKGPSPGNGNGQADPDQVADMLSRMSKPDRDHFLMKAALANPTPLIR